MRVLLIKTSSMGDVIHTLPAITDLAAHFPNLELDWVVEEGFTEVPSWHPHVNRVIPVAVRRWRKNLKQFVKSGEWAACKQQAAGPYDVVIDAQGLLKSAVLTRAFAKLSPGCRVIGYDKKSIREPLASVFYREKMTVSREQHAVTRIRQLFAQAFNYPLPETAPDYGLDRNRFGAKAEKPTVLLLHGTTRFDKHWPDKYWETLAELLGNNGYQIQVPWFSEAEQRRALKLADAHQNVCVLARTNLAGMAAHIASAHAIVAVDTGLGHLAAALAVPTLSLYGPTSPALIGAFGPNQYHLQASAQPPVNAKVEPEVFAPLTPALVFAKLNDIIHQPVRQSA